MCVALLWPGIPAGTLSLSSAFYGHVTLEQVQCLSSLRPVPWEHVTKKQVQSLPDLQNKVMTPHPREMLRPQCKGRQLCPVQDMGLSFQFGWYVGRLWFAVSYFTAILSLYLAFLLSSFLTQQPTTFLSSSAFADLASPTLKISRYSMHTQKRNYTYTLHMGRVYTQCHRV